MELLPKDRRLQKRNSHLQKQLGVTMQILGEEYRQTKEQLDKDQRDCGIFLQVNVEDKNVDATRSYLCTCTGALYNTIPGLQHYGYPDTRAMKSNHLLKDRRLSMVSKPTLSEEEVHYQHYPHHSPPKLMATAAAVAVESQKGGRNGSADSLRNRISSTDWVDGSADSLRNKNSSTDWVGGSDLDAEGAVRSGLSGRDHPGLKTDGAVKDATFYNSIIGQGQKKRPSTSFGHFQSCGGRYGKDAYTERDHLVHDRVMREFHVIFDPVTKAGKMSLSLYTSSKPIVMNVPEMTHKDQDDHGLNDQRVLATTQTDEETSRQQKRAGVGQRRVVWSAHPSRRRDVSSIKDNVRKQRPSSTSQLKPATPASSKVHSPSMAAPKTSTSPGGVNRQSSPLAHPESHQIPAAVKGNELGGKVRPVRKDSEAPSQISALSCHTSKTTSDSQMLPLHQDGTTKSSVVPSPGQECTSLYTQSRTQQSEKPPPGNQANGVLVRNGNWRLSSRVSIASEVNPPVNLLEDLLKASIKLGGAPKRPKTAPSKSELRHRSMPVSRQTVMGILAEIENQKAYTRTMLSTSQQLCKLIKKLVPSEQLPVKSSENNG